MQSIDQSSARAAGNMQFLLIVLILSLLASCTTSDTINQNPQPDETEVGEASEPETQPDMGDDTGDAGVQTGDGCITTAALQTEFIRLVNAARSEPRMCGSTNFPAAAPVTWDERLEGAARVHSIDQANNLGQNRQLFHTGSDGSDVGDRVTRQNYVWRTVAENIAGGFVEQSDTGSMESVMQGWLGSEGHCRNIMSSAVTEIGVSCWDNADSVYQRYWTQVFARPQP